MFKIIDKKFICAMVVFNIMFMALLVCTCSAEVKYTQDEINYLSATNDIGKAYDSTLKKYIGATKNMQNGVITESEAYKIFDECITENNNYCFALNDRQVPYIFNEYHCKNYMLYKETILEIQLYKDAYMNKDVKKLKLATEQITKVNGLMSDLTLEINTITQ